MSTTGRAGVSAPRPRPRYTKGERTKVRIVDAAVELYSRSGFNAVSLRDIAAQAGLTHAGLLHHFPGGREALLLEVLARRDAIDAESLDDPELSARDHLDRLLRVVRRNAGTPGLVAMYAKVSNEATSPDHPAHEYFTQRYRVLREYLGDILERVQHDAAMTGREPCCAPRELAVRVLALMDGLQTQWLLDPEIDMAAHVAGMLAAHGVSPSPGWDS
jgi:AcrR family transcriptional regulator